MENVLIGVPVRDRVSQLGNLLRDIVELRYDKAKVELVFFVNDSGEAVKDLLDSFSLVYTDEFKSLRVVEQNFGSPIDRRVGSVRAEIYGVLVVVRNNLLDYFLDSDCSFLCMVDSDTRLHPRFLEDTLVRFDDKHCIVFPKLSVDYNGGVLWNCMEIRENGIFHLRNFPREDIFKVVVCGGGCVVMSRVVVNKGVRFKYHSQGEFVGFSLDCRDKGIGLWCSQKQGLAYHDMQEF